MIANNSITDLLQEIQNKLLGTEKLPLIDHTLKSAAVLVLLIPSQTGLEVVLTRRAPWLKHHPGQISFPGGQFEKSDLNLIDTAMREANEEIGLPLENLKILGSFEGCETISDFYVTPIVAFSTFKGPWHCDKNEVSEIIQVPFSWFINDLNWRLENGQFMGREHQYLVSWWDSHLIWGATARLTANLRKQLSHWSR